MTRFFVLSALSLLVLSTTSHASITLQFSQTAVGRATGFANSAGTITNGMNWGILIDGSGNGFSSAYDAPSSAATSGFLSNNSVVTDDYFVTTGLLTANQTPTGTDPGGAGGISSLAGIFTSYPAGIGQGDAFRIIWFDGAPAAGSKYGLFSDASFTLPSDGSTTSYASVFSGSTADPAKPANLSFNSAGPIPEPSRALLLGFGALGLMFRRRRA